jgi:quercetin dioxygenase-like cupin family protein
VQPIPYVAIPTLNIRTAFMQLRLVASLFASAMVMVAGVMVASPAVSAGSQPMAVSCTVLLPPSAVPGLPGSLRMIEKLVIPPGHDGHRHVHDVVEYLTIISGTGSLSVDRQPDQPLAPGTVSEIPPRTQHQLRNASDSEPLVFTATFIGKGGKHALTTYRGEKDVPAGCPHRLPG